MRRILTAAIGLLLILFYCAGCKTVKNVQRDKEKTSIKLDSAGTSKVKTDLAEKVTSTTTITEEADTSSVVKGSMVTGDTPMASFAAGQPFTIQDDNVVATVTEEGGKLKLIAITKDRKADLKYKKTTATTAVIDRRQESQASASVKKSEEKQEEKKASEKHVQRSGPGVFGWIIIVLLALVIAAGLTKNYWQKFIP